MSRIPPAPTSAYGRWRNALEQAGNEIDERTQQRKLRVLANRVMDWALEGQAWAVLEVGNRHDGRPHQAVALTGPDGESLPSLSAAELCRRLSCIIEESRRSPGDGARDVTPGVPMVVDGTPPVDEPDDGGGSGR